MITLRKLSLSFIFATTFLTHSASVVYGMEDELDPRTIVALQVKHDPIPKAGMEGEESNNDYALTLSASTDGTKFDPIPPEQAEQLINHWASLVGASLEVKSDEGRVFCFQKQAEQASLMNADQAETMLLKLLKASQEAYQAQQAWDISSEKRVAQEKAEKEKEQAQEIENLRASLAAAQQALLAQQQAEQERQAAAQQAPKWIKIQKDEYERLKAEGKTVTTEEIQVAAYYRIKDGNAKITTQSHYYDRLNKRGPHSVKIGPGTDTLYYKLG